MKEFDGHLMLLYKKQYEDISDNAHCNLEYESHCGHMTGQTVNVDAEIFQKLNIFMLVLVGKLRRFCSLLVD